MCTPLEYTLPLLCLFIEILTLPAIHMKNGESEGKPVYYVYDFVDKSNNEFTMGDFECV
jgi:hypothetical protein